MDTVVTRPCHSLIQQSLHAHEAKTVTNGDGFGLGWYGDREEPGIYRELRPAWSDENLKALCEQVRSQLFFAHVRASTGTATSRANCHPFSHGRHMFMHNGQVGCYARLRRRIENMIPDAYYGGRAGTTDSEAIFLCVLARGGATDPIAATASVLGDLKTMMAEEGVCEPLRFTAAFTNGRDLYAFRWACDQKAPTLYWREVDDALHVVSEPFDDRPEAWAEVPQGHALVARDGRAAELVSFDIGAWRAAA
jgi:glutamine amidotransferase